MPTAQGEREEHKEAISLLATAFLKLNQYRQLKVRN